MNKMNGWRNEVNKRAKKGDFRSDFSCIQNFVMFLLAITGNGISQVNHSQCHCSDPLLKLSTSLLCVFQHTNWDRNKKQNVEHIFTHQCQEIKERLPHNNVYAFQWYRSR